MEENVPPTRWKLAQVISTHPGEDKVTLRTTKGELTRPIHNLVLLLGPDRSKGGNLLETGRVGQKIMMMMSEKMTSDFMCV